MAKYTKLSSWWLFWGWPYRHHVFAQCQKSIKTHAFIVPLTGSISQEYKSIAIWCALNMWTFVYWHYGNNIISYSLKVDIYEQIKQTHPLNKWKSLWLNNIRLRRKWSFIWLRDKMYIYAYFSVAMKYDDRMKDDLCFKFVDDRKL